MLDGAFQVAMGAGLLSDSRNVIRVVVGALLIIVGLGLLFRVRILRGVAHILCWLALADGAWSVLVGLTVGTLAFGPISFIFVIFAILRVALSAFMIYLIGETETYYPT
jgi:hypothetical protein